MQLEETNAELSNQVYLDNSGIFLMGSGNMIEKLKEGNSFFFTVSAEDFRKILGKAEIKDSGKKFDNMTAMFIPNSHIEVHISKEIEFSDHKIAIQIRERYDKRGLNIFVSKSTNVIGHKIELKSEFTEKEDFYNEIHIKSRDLNNNGLYISITPI